MKAIAIGVGATMLMDLWHLVLRRGFGVASLNYCMLGRLLRQRRECLTGWAAHYAIGVALAVGFVAVAPEAWISRPTLSPAIGFGIVTVVFPFFILQPALGLGIASSRANNPALARWKSIATHAVYGAGLYLSAQFLSW